MFVGLGMYCIGGFVFSLVLAILVSIMIIWAKQEQERLVQEEEKRLQEYEEGKREA